MLIYIELTAVLFGFVLLLCFLEGIRDVKFQGYLRDEGFAQDKLGSGSRG